MSNDKKPEHNDLSFYQPLDENFQLPDTEKQKYENIQMLDGEELTIGQNFTIKDPDDKTFTELYLTNYRLIVARKIPKSIPYGYIQSYEKGDKVLKIKLKTGVIVEIHTQQTQLLESSLKICFTDQPFCFKILAEEKPHIYDSGAQIQRMRIDRNQYTTLKNTNGAFCSTYPCFIIIPKSIHPTSFSVLKKCRYLSRIPVMSYFHEQYSVGIWRAAKLKPKLGSDVLQFDTAYRKQISEDLVTYSIEQENEGNCCSFESLSGVRKNFFNLVSSYILVSKADGNSKADSFLKSLSKWYQEIQKLISLAYRIVFDLVKKNHVLLEELYGFDRIPQIMSLCEIIIDPFYRTFNGLSILIEKQFMCFGHPFETRSGFTKNKHQQVSPVFIQFLECLHQLVICHPEVFQYSSHYLARLAYEVYTTKFKNFIERKGDIKTEEQLKKCPQCIWKSLVKEKSYYNYQWEGNSGIKELWQIRKKPYIKEYSIWNEYYEMITKMEVQKKINGNQQKKYETLYSFIHKKRNAKQ